jgi:hypothetical protein
MRGERSEGDSPSCPGKTLDLARDTQKGRNMPIKTVAAKLMGRWKQLLGGLIAALLLLPVPAMALTFSGHWKAIVQRQGRPKPQRPTFTDVPNNPGQMDMLTVNMGNYQGVKSTATSSIDLTHRFTITAPQQQIKLNDQFASQFAQAGARVTVTIKDAQGHVLRTPLRFRGKIRSASFGTLQADLAKFLTLRKGHYILDVQVIFQTDRKRGGWNTISPHKFVFMGV